MAIYTYTPFGYEGSLVTVETDLRRGIPMFDIVGLADGAVKESCERIRAGFKNQDFELPSERILISLSPADIKKERAGFDLPIALSILSEMKDYPRSQDARVLVMGELELSGKLRPIRGCYPALVAAVATGIKYAIVPKGVETAKPEGIHVEYVETLRDAYDALVRIDEYEAIGDVEEENKSAEPAESEIEFEDFEEMNLDSIEGHSGLKYAMAVAVAGRHNILAYGAPGCGKTLVLQHMPELMPHLTREESHSTTRIHSIAGLLRADEDYMKIRPFRMPHQTASIEGIYGGGPNCRPGEISLAHKGVLFLDEAAEFRYSVLQMLKIPLETKQITLSRAGHTTVYPADFQLVMATNPCPCGNYGSKDKVCLCSMKLVELYWKKFSAPLLDRIEIRFDCNKDNDSKEYTIDELRGKIKQAFERQYKRQGKLNELLNAEEVNRYIKLTNEASEYLQSMILEHGFTPRTISGIYKVAQTLADMNDTEPFLALGIEHVKAALKFRENLDKFVEIK